METVKKKVNPFDEGVSYLDVLKDLGTKSVETHYKDLLTKEQREWLKVELELFKNNQKNK
jgi:hypothetical protein